MPDIIKLQQRLHYTFKDIDVLRLALVHRSYLNESQEPGISSNERLEFLGDAVLGLVVAQELYQLNPDWSEGEMTRLRSLLVRRETLAELARGLDLGSYLCLGKGEAASGGRERPSNLASALEAVIGATFLDGGFRAAKRVVLRLLGREMETVTKSKPPTDYKSRLQEVVQARRKVTPTYRTVAVVGPEYDRQFMVEVLAGDEVLGRGRGLSKQLAEMDAARAALEALEAELRQRG